MALFTGTYKGKVDQKGRASLPADFRDILSKDGNRSFYIYPSPKGDCLEATDEDYLQSMADSIEAQAPMFSEEELRLSFIISNARKVSYDSTGRFVIPAELAEFAEISDQAVFVGVSARFQIKPPSAHTDSLRDQLKMLKDVTLKIDRSRGA